MDNGTWQKELEKIWDNMIKQQVPEKLTNLAQEDPFYSFMMDETDFLFCGLKELKIEEISET